VDDSGVATGWYKCGIQGQIGPVQALRVSIHSATADVTSTRLNSIDYYIWGANFTHRDFMYPYTPDGLDLVSRAADTVIPAWQFIASDLHNPREDSTKWVDWYSADFNRLLGAEWIPNVSSGFHIQSNAGIRRLQAPAIRVFMPRTETGIDAAGVPLNENSVFMQLKWSWTDGERANKWGTARQQYKPKPLLFIGGGPAEGTLTDFPLVVTKTRPRGQGKALQFAWTGEALKEFHIQGWAVTYQTDGSSV
jgi:hypothetical protein